MPRTIAIGDIHGCHIALATLLDHLEPQPDDRFIILGDVVDRGPGTRQVIERLLALGSTCELITIRGNHEEMMLDGLGGGKMASAWLRYGGQEVVRSYGGSLGNIPPEHIEFLAGMRDYYETETEIYIHANLEPEIPLDQQTADWLRWEHLSVGWRRPNAGVVPHFSGRRVICGHTSQKNGLPYISPDESWVCIDTFAHGSGFLTALEVGPDRVYQANQDGVYRGGLVLMDLV